MKEIPISNEKLVSQIKIESSDLQTELANIAGLYADVFSGPPWNEFTLCPNDKTFFGKETKPGDLCRKCNKELIPAYPLDKTQNYILKEYLRPNGIVLIAKNGNEMVGFAWGFSYEKPLEFASEKYRTEDMQQKVISVLENNGIDKKFFYFSEAGVVENFRGYGLSNQLSRLLFEQGEKLKYPVVMRTNCCSPMVKIANNFEMKLVYGPITKVNTEKKEFVKTGDVINFLDTENEERVLFVKETPKGTIAQLPRFRSF